jgi:hypothetical protein
MQRRHQHRSRNYLRRHDRYPKCHRYLQYAKPPVPPVIFISPPEAAPPACPDAPDAVIEMPVPETVVFPPAPKLAAPPAPTVMVRTCPGVTVARLITVPPAPPPAPPKPPPIPSCPPAPPPVAVILSVSYVCGARKCKRSSSCVCHRGTGRICYR